MKTELIKALTRRPGAAAAVLLAWLALVLTLAPAPVHAEGPPQRVVSLLPSLTEVVCALDVCERLVGVDRYSNWPASVQALPQLGGGLDPNVEAIVALQPDLVLLAASSRAALRLRSLGLNVRVLEPKNRASLERTVHELTEALGLPAQRGSDLLAQIDAGVRDAAARVPEAVRGWRVYFEVSPAPYAAGPASFIGELLQALGLDNIIGPELGPFPKINPELVVRADPDLIMVSQNARELLLGRPGWASLSALRTPRLCEFAPEQRDVMVRPGPRLPEAAQLVLDCLLRLGDPAKQP